MRNIRCKTRRKTVSFTESTSKNSDFYSRSLSVPHTVDSILEGISLLSLWSSGQPGDNRRAHTVNIVRVQNFGNNRLVISYFDLNEKKKKCRIREARTHLLKQSSGYQSFQLKVTFYCWVGGGGGVGERGWLSFLSFGQEGGCKRNTYDVGGHERKNALLKKSSALLHFTKHNKCSLRIK